MNVTISFYRDLSGDAKFSQSRRILSSTILIRLTSISWVKVCLRSSRWAVNRLGYYCSKWLQIAVQGPRCIYSALSIYDASQYRPLPNCVGSANSIGSNLFNNQSGASEDLHSSWRRWTVHLEKKYQVWRLFAACIFCLDGEVSTYNPRFFFMLLASWWINCMTWFYYPFYAQYGSWM